MRIIKFIFLFFIVIFLVGCAVNIKSLPTSRAKLGTVTAVYPYLRSIPAPKEKIVAAVYKFRDQTGQYKTSAVGVTWSTAVTQGTTSMLLKSLEDSGWFVTLEREGLSNLLNERKIIRSTRENYTNHNKNKLQILPPLLYAGITLEGGIIAYETNLVTGGFGARYFGIGGNAQYRKDQVSIYLRAVSTQNGRILKTVYTTKSILSQLVDVGLYKYVKFKRLLEVETGYSSNEPPQLCVLEAIEKAVYSLIIEGINDKLWELKNPEDINSAVIQSYFKEKEEVEPVIEYDKQGEIVSSKNLYYTNFIANNRWGIGGNVSAQTYAGDYPNPELKLAGNFMLKYGFSPRFFLMLSGGGGELADRDFFIAKTVHFDFKAMFAIFPKKRLCPYLCLGISALNFWTKDKDNLKIYREKKYWGWEPAVVSGIGLEYFLLSHFGLNFCVENYFCLTDELDGIVHGKKDDYPWCGRMGIVFYF